MNTSYLKYVVEVGRVQSITKAARNLYMGQPNLSKAIRELEREIGITIFRRTSKGVIPTPEGREFLGYAEGILGQLDDLASLYKSRGEGESLEIHVAVPRTAYAAAVFAEYLNNRCQMTHIDVHFRETDTNNVIHMVTNGEADFGIIRCQVSQQSFFENIFAQLRLKSEVLREFNMMLMMSENHPLASQKSIEYHQLAGYPEIVHGEYQLSALSVHKIRRGTDLKSEMKRITVYDRGSQYDLLRRIPGSYMWTSPVIPDVLEQNNLVVRPCALSEVLNMDVLIFPENVPLSEQAEALAEEFRRAARKQPESEENISETE